MTTEIEKASVSVGTENGHRHTFDPAVNKGTTSEDHGHIHEYNLDKGVTEFSSDTSPPHRHSIPNVLKRDIVIDVEGNAYNKEDIAEIIRGMQSTITEFDLVRKENEKVFAKASCNPKHSTKEKSVEIEIEVKPTGSEDEEEENEEEMEKAQPTIGDVHVPSALGGSRKKEPKKPKDVNERLGKQEKVMPYATNAELPDNVRNVLPAAAQSIFRNVFNSAVGSDASEDSARKQAWGALKNQGWEKGDGDKWIKVKKSEGNVVIRWNDPNSDPVKDLFNYDYTLESESLTILKQDDEQQLITGIVMEPDTVDSQGDKVSKEEIQKAAFKFLIKSRTIGLQHKKKGPLDVVESFIVPDNMEMGGQKVKKGSWLMTVKVNDGKVWQNVKDGKYTGFSIGGYAAKS